MVQYVLGIDSGGTHFRVAAANLQGTILAEYIGDTASHYYFETQELNRRINHHIDACLQQFGGKREDCAALLCGTTGLDSEEDDILLHQIYGALPGFSCPVKVINDAQLAHDTVTGGVGLLVISGTGSIAYGCNAQGETARMGGWLFSIMGDEGGGNWITRHALRHVGAVLDKAVPDGPMAQMIRQELSISTRKELSDLAAEIATPPWQEPKLGAIVDKAATMGDTYAKALIVDAAHKTFALIYDLSKVLHMDKTPDLKIGVWGSTILKSKLHLQTFTQLQQEKLPQATILLPEKNAVEGAVQMALEMINNG